MINETLPQMTPAITTQSESILKLLPALIKAQSEFPDIPRNGSYKRGGTLIKYAKIDDIITTIRPILNKHNLLLTQRIVGNTIYTFITHLSGEWIMCAEPIIAPKDDSQRRGGGITYGRRYSIGALLGLALEDDDDGKSLTEPDEKPKSKPTGDIL